MRCVLVNWAIQPLTTTAPSFSTFLLHSFIHFLSISFDIVPVATATSIHLICFHYLTRPIVVGYVEQNELAVSFLISNAYFMANNVIFMVNWTHFFSRMDFQISISIRVIWINLMISFRICSVEKKTPLTDSSCHAHFFLLFLNHWSHA